MLPRSGENRTMRATRLNGRRTTRERRPSWKAYPGRIPGRVSPFREREREGAERKKERVANYARPVYQIEEGERDAGKERMRRSKKFQEAGGTVKISTTSTYLRGHGPWSLELVEEKGA